MEDRRRLRSLWRRNELERGLHEEMRVHVDRQTEKHLRAGMAPDGARRLALVEFGGVELAKGEHTRPVTSRIHRGRPSRPPSWRARVVTHSRVHDRLHSDAGARHRRDHRDVLIGIDGIVSYAVSRRRREIGVRLALGAAYGEIRRMFVRRALALVGIGAAIGLAAAVGLTRLMASQLFGISPLDPLTHVSVALFLVGAAALASYLSARRASALDPVDVLKGE